MLPFPCPTPQHSPVPHHIDGPDAHSLCDLDDSLPHAAVGRVLDDGVPWRAQVWHSHVGSHPSLLRGHSTQHTWRQALEVAQHAERRAGVDAERGSAQQWDVAGHPQQAVLREHRVCPPRPWAAGKGQRWDTLHCALTHTAAAPPCSACGKHRTATYETFSSVGRARMLM